MPRGEKETLLFDPKIEKTLEETTIETRKRGYKNDLSDNKTRL